MKKISEEKRGIIINLLDSGLSAREIAKQCNVGRSTVNRIRNKLRPDINKPTGGRPDKLTNQTKCYIVRSISSGQSDTATNITKQLKNDAIVDVNSETVRHTLRKSGLTARKKVKKPRLQHHHKKKRYEFAEKYKDWTVEDWKQVIWSDETKVNRIGSDGCKWVWKKSGDSGIKDREVEGTVKFGGGSLMVWGCFTAKGVGYLTRIDGGLNAELYVNILNDELIQTLEYYEYSKDDIVFQQDNDPKHTSRLAKNWFAENEIEVLDWPPQSPDLNPIEHLWIELKKRLNSYSNEATSMHQLWERIEETWNSISIETCMNLIESMPNRINAVLKVKGGYTKY